MLLSAILLKFKLLTRVWAEGYSSLFVCVSVCLSEHFFKYYNGFFIFSFQKHASIIFKMHLLCQCAASFAKGCGERSIKRRFLACISKS